MHKTSSHNIQSVYKSNIEGNITERFQRPSKQKAFKLKYHFKDFETAPDYNSYIFKKSEDVIQAYFAILKEAANMQGYYGGCGTIGQSNIPYPYAYKLLTEDAKKQLSLKKFIESFSGIGHITLLHLYPAYTPTGTPDNIKYYMVEMEIIGGFPYKQSKKTQPTYFAYYYGIITTEFSSSSGWKIKELHYIPEDFLCAPYHHWYWEAQAMVDIIYKDWYGLIDRIEKNDIELPFIYVYARGKDQRYRFDFLRLTNGEDIMLHENRYEKGKWKEVNILKPEHQFYKLSILKFKKQQALE